MKRLIALLLLCTTVFCSCTGVADAYEKAYAEVKERKSYAVTIENVMTVERAASSEEETQGDSEDAAEQSGTDTYSERVEFAQGNGILSAKVTNDDGYSEYYYKDGSVYYSSGAGSYCWDGETDEFYSSFCWATPLSHDFNKGEKEDGVSTYILSADGDEYKDMLLGLNPAMEDFGITESDFTSFTYTAKVKDGKLIEYIYDFSLDATAGGERAVITNVMIATYSDETVDVVMPSGYESFISAGGNVSDLSEEAFTQEVMLIIVEALYNSDGTRKDDFDQTYAEFVAMYGEDVMSTFIGGIEEYNESIGLGSE